MADPRIPLKNPLLAAVLAYLVPGAGHLYQGRTFKGALYLVCILGTYLAGLSMSDWKAVYWRMDPRERNIAFFAQAGVGMFAIPAVVQSKRYLTAENLKPRLDRPLSEEFHGALITSDDKAPQEIIGQVELHETAGDFGLEIRGQFVGRVLSPDGESRPIELELADPVDIGPKVGPGAGRPLKCVVVGAAGGGDDLTGWIDGAIPRNFVDYFAAPLGDEDLERLNGQLPRNFELAKVFTWIAGLLNILALWDAYEGPAYGYGDEDEDESPDDKEGAAKAAGSKENSPPEPAGKTAAG